MKRREPSAHALVPPAAGPAVRTASGVRRIEPAVEALRTQAAQGGLVVCELGLWFRTPQGEMVSVERWRPLQRLLARLAEQRETAPAQPLSVEELIAAGWPGERMLPKAGATRVYSAVASLRRLGLREVLVRDGRGYVLDANVPITRVATR